MIPVIPANHAIRQVPVAAEIYQYDASPLGERQPVLLVHGLNGEYVCMFHLRRICKYLAGSETFQKRYKIYVARYDTHAPEKTVVAAFGPAIRQLADAGGRPIVVVAISIAGSIIRDSLSDPAVDRSVSRLITMGAQFHGSPIFSKDWMRYSIMKRYRSPLSRLDRIIGYSVYFGIHPNLLVDYYWDNCDSAVPAIGSYRFKFPIAVKGVLLPPNNPPPGASLIQGANKIIAYAGYLENPYISNHNRSLALAFLRVPSVFINTVVPAQFGRQRAVLRVLNDAMAKVVQTERKEKVAYALNDGISPVASSLSVPSENIANINMNDEQGIAKLQSQINVRKARVFQNIDHLTFLDGRGTFSRSKDIVDRLSPNEKPRPMFAWLLSDILE